MPAKNTAFNVSLCLYKNDGTLIANPGTITAKISKDWGNYENIGTVTEEDSTYGQIKLALTATEMNADVVDLYVVDNTSGCVPWTATIYTTPEPVNVTQWLGTAPAPPDTAGIPKVNVQEISGGDVDGNNATLNLKRLLIDAGATGNAFEARSNAGAGAYFSTTMSGRAAIEAAGDPGPGMSLTSSSSAGLEVIGSGGLDIDANLAGKVLGTGSGTITAVGAWAAGASGSAVALQGADSDTLKTLSDQLDAMAGSGFSTTTDSLEAIRNRGDAAWTTGTGAAASKAYALASLTRTIGDNDGGVLSDTVSFGGSAFVTGEVAANPGLQVDGYATADADSEAPTELILWSLYSGSGTHWLNVYAYNYTDSAYEPIGTIANGAELEAHRFGLTPQHIDTVTNPGRISFQVLHNSVAGNASHYFSIDKALVTTTEAVTGITAADVRIEMDAHSTQLAAIVEDTGTTLPASIADVPTVSEFEARTIAAADYATATAQTTAQGVLDKLDSTMELDGAGPAYQFTTDALDQAPTGGGSLTAGDAEQIRYKLNIDGTQTAPTVEGTADRTAAEATVIRWAQESIIATNSMGLIGVDKLNPGDLTIAYSGTITGDAYIRVQIVDLRVNDTGATDPARIFTVGNLTALGWTETAVEDWPSEPQKHMVRFTFNKGTGGIADGILTLTLADTYTHGPWEKGWSISVGGWTARAIIPDVSGGFRYWTGFSNGTGDGSDGDWGTMGYVMPPPSQAEKNVATFDRSVLNEITTTFSDGSQAKATLVSDKVATVEKV